MEKNTNKRTRLDEYQSSTIDPVPSDEPVKISKSCDVCRVKKLKCNSHSICGYCNKHQLSCVYSIVKKPGLKPGYGKDVDRRLLNLEGSARNFEEEFKILHSKVNELQNQIFMQPRSTVTSNASIVSSVPNLLNTATAVYLPPQFSTVSGIRKSQADQLSPRNALDGFPNSEVVQSFGPEGIPLGSLLLSPEQLNDVVEVFFAQVFPIFPIIHPSQTRSKIECYIRNVLSTQKKKQQIEPPLILYGLILISIRFLSAEKPPNLSDSQLMDLYTTCKEKIILNCYSVSSFQQLQTITLLAFDSLGRSNGTESWSLIGISTSGAIHLNLSDMQSTIPPLPSSSKNDHSPASVSSESSTLSSTTNENKRSKTIATKQMNLLKKPKNWVEVESRRRLFWGISILDTLSAIVSGLPQKLPKLEIQFSPPYKTDLWISSGDSVDSTLPDFDLYKDQDMEMFDSFSYYIDICKIFGEVHIFLRAPLNIVDNLEVGGWFIEFHRLENKVYSWKENLPHKYQKLLEDNQLNPSDRDSSHTFVYGVLLHALYNVTLVKLNSAYGYPHAESLAFQHSRHSRRMCLKCVENVITLSSKVIEWEGHTKYNACFELLGPHYAFYVWVCCRLLIAEFLVNLKDNIPNDKERISRNLRIFADILKRIGKYWLVSEKYHNILTKLITLDIEFHPVSSGEERDEQENIQPSNAIADMRINTYLLSLILTGKITKIDLAESEEDSSLNTKTNSSTNLLEMDRVGTAKVRKEKDHHLLEAFELDTTSFGFEDLFKYLDYNETTTF